MHVNVKDVMEVLGACVGGRAIGDCQSKVAGGASQILDVIHQLAIIS